MSLKTVPMFGSHLQLPPHWPQILKRTFWEEAGVSRSVKSAFLKACISVGLSWGATHRVSGWPGAVLPAQCSYFP